jgi:type VI secretion system protein ImpA
VDALRRTPIVSHRQLGSFSLRDVELSTGQLAPAETDTQIPNPAQIEATLAASPVEELQALAARLAAATGALKNIVSVMQDKAGFQSAPDFDPLLKPLSHMQKRLAEHLPGRATAQAGTPVDDPAHTGEGVTPTGVTAGGIGQIRSRQDAIRAIDAAAAYFRNNEPSSPVPLLLDRAKRLVSKSFMEVLEDIAPDSLPQARLIGGIRNDES